MLHDPSHYETPVEAETIRLSSAEQETLRQDENRPPLQEAIFLVGKSDIAQQYQEGDGLTPNKIIIKIL